MTPLAARFGYRSLAASMGAALVIAFAESDSRAQEFASPSAAPALTGDLLERGLPAAAGEVSFSSLSIGRPLGLTTHSLELALGARSIRFAVGLSRTGDPDLGWSTGAAAMGIAGAEGGAAVRGAIRRDDAAPVGEERNGIEIGGGAWVKMAGVRGWACAPQAWLGGLAPPLARGLVAGLDLAGGGCTLGLSREAPRRGFAEPAAWSARVGLALGGLSLWTEGREHPWRGGVGLAAAAGPLRLAAQVDTHPVLDPTARVAISLRSRGRAP